MSLPSDLSAQHQRQIDATDARIAAARDTFEEMAGLSGPTAQALAAARNAADDAEAAARWWSPASRRRARSAREAVATAQAELDSCVQKRDRAKAELAAAQRQRENQEAEHIADRAALDAYVRGREPADAAQAERMTRLRQLRAEHEDVVPADTAPEDVTNSPRRTDDPAHQDRGGPDEPPFSEGPRRAPEPRPRTETEQHIDTLSARLHDLDPHDHATADRIEREAVQHLHEQVDADGKDASEVFDAAGRFRPGVVDAAVADHLAQTVARLERERAVQGPDAEVDRHRAPAAPEEPEL